MEPIPPPPHDHFAPINPNIQVVHDDMDDRYEEAVRYEERLPTVQQRINSLSLDDDVHDVRPRNGRLRPSDMIASSKDFLYYRLKKKGSDWSTAVRTTISAPVEDIEKKARRTKGGDRSVLDQLTSMPKLRRELIEDVVQMANANETGDAHWEVAYIKSTKQLRRDKTIEVPEMDIILERIRGRTKTRPKSFHGDVVSIRDPGKRVGKEKKYNDDNYTRSRKDSGLAMLADPISDLPLFDMNGRPRDELGPMHFDNAGLPEQIPKERPLGAKLDHKKEDKGEKREKSRKRSKSRERDFVQDDNVVVVPEGGFPDNVDPLPIDGILGEEAKSDKRGRQGKSPHAHPEVVGENLPRSHSRRRGHAESRGISRDKSRSRRSSVHFPNQHTRQYFEASSASSEASDSSHYGFVEYAESSNTSLGTPGGVPRRGSLVRVPPREDTVYKKHYRGPARSVSYSEKPYYSEQHYIVPARSRRDSYAVYERPIEGPRYERPLRPTRQMTVPIPEERQILYHDLSPQHRSGEIVPVRRTYEAPLTRHMSYDSSMPVVTYPDEERDVYIREELERQSSRVEDYQRDRVREEFLKEREREVSARERDLEIQEEELRRLRREREREYYDERDRRERRALYRDEKTGQYFYYE
ncbi:uncharacterized protein Z518_03199 [Rhinocladiella mackenziei CBS 650.93]|uniref:Apoptosis regulator Bcl-2 family BH4 domain-containing protein n=1 Tax=Rhinocladiella mackenziei CBS 650.93 TaxID=1442369 RepID=A0A0D2HDG4_9EURO|nr:uncharacterized protein Z518_03199 [Rhinocladiella mackenziei CBS 650.93]KIX08543.1 hypothetical protein Z518_03199 [Rhinocladiella mackenziei CBS 650.93]